MPKPIILIAIAVAMALPMKAPAQTRQGPTAPPTIYTPKSAPTPTPAPAPTARPEPVSAPTESREAPVNGVLFLYGEKAQCPVDSNGNEITVCVRRPAGEQFRIPKEIRPESIKPEYQSWANRQDSILDAGGSPLGSCSPVGAGGQTGCHGQTFRRARTENKARKEAEAANSPR